MIVTGKWAWWNQYGTVPLETCIRRAKAVNGVIVKAGYGDILAAFLAAGVRCGVESYVYPTRPAWEASLLAEGIQHGAEFVVINAEAEWEETDGSQMAELIAQFQRRQSGVEIYASVDTRGNRMTLPYQQVLGRHCEAWMPMIYPLAFYPNRPPGYVAQAFRDCLDVGQDFQGKPVFPTCQTYAGIGAEAVVQQWTQADDRSCLGWQAYTLAHATMGEWMAFTEHEDEQEEALREFVERVNAEKMVGGLFAEAQGQALQGRPLPQELTDQLMWLIGASG